MSERPSNLENARFMLVAGLDADTWTLHIEGKFTLSEIPRLKRLLDIYASLADPPNPAAERTEIPSQQGANEQSP